MGERSRVHYRNIITTKPTNYLTNKLTDSFCYCECYCKRRYCYRYRSYYYEYDYYYSYYLRLLTTTYCGYKLWAQACGRATGHCDSVWQAVATRAARLACGHKLGHRGGAAVPLWQACVATSCVPTSCGRKLVAATPQATSCGRKLWPQSDCGLWLVDDVATNCGRKLRSHGNAATWPQACGHQPLARRAQWPQGCGRKLVATSCASSCCPYGPQACGRKLWPRKLCVQACGHATSCGKKL